MKADVVVVGAGVMGASVAYWLTRIAPLQVVLVERDRTYARASSALSASSIRQQFSSPVNIVMSLFGAQFLREARIPFNESGYLYLGTRRALEALHAVQKNSGADVALLAPEALAARFPWLNVQDVECGSLGLSKEGWFDGTALHQAFLHGARERGARLVEAEATEIVVTGGKARGVVLAGGEAIECLHVVNAAGAWARPLAATAGVDLPVYARRRTVFVLSCPKPLPGCPLVIDPSNFWFRPDGEVFIAGREPDPDADDLPLEPNLLEFDEHFWAQLAHRVPAFEALRVQRAWAGYYEMNVFDHNALIGAHPAVDGLWFCNGFSGHGMQQAAAAGRGLAELIATGAFRTLDLSALGLARLVAGRPLIERNVIG